MLLLSVNRAGSGFSFLRGKRRKKSNGGIIEFLNRECVSVGSHLIGNLTFQLFICLEYVSGSQRAAHSPSFKFCLIILLVKMGNVCGGAIGHALVLFIEWSRWGAFIGRQREVKPLSHCL